MSPPKPKPDDADALRARALGLLARREHSRAELRRKLATRDTDREALEELLGRLAAANLQSDERFAESFLRSRVERGQGPLRIREELRQRGVDDATAAAALEAAAVDWGELLRAVHRKRFGSAPPADRREFAQRARFLAQRGFAAEAIRNLLTDLDEA